MKKLSKSEQTDKYNEEFFKCCEEANETVDKMIKHLHALASEISSNSNKGDLAKSFIRHLESYVLTKYNR